MYTWALIIAWNIEILNILHKCVYLMLQKFQMFKFEQAHQHLILLLTENTDTLCHDLLIPSWIR